MKIRVDRIIVKSLFKYKMLSADVNDNEGYLNDSFIDEMADRSQ